MCIIMLLLTYNVLSRGVIWCTFCGLLSFSGVPHLDKTKWCNLKLLVTWVGPLNLSKVCAIFSVSMVPQPCPAHSLQFVRFRHISAWEIVPHTTGAPVAAEPTSSTCGWLTDWLLTGWGFLGYHEKVCQTCRLAKTRPRGPCLLTLLSQVATETNFHWKNEQSRDVPLSCSKQSMTAVIHCVVTVVTLH